MEGFSEPAPGLLDVPQLQVLDFPPRSELRIAPIRDPVPLRASNIPSPLEPNTPQDGEFRISTAKIVDQKSVSAILKKTPPITPATVILARDARKPITAISELIESESHSRPADHHAAVPLPSFVTLSAVENSFVASSGSADELRASKRPRLEMDNTAPDDYIHLPRPHQKQQGQRAPPLLPAMVNGIHEPPPNAALLPPMDTEKHTVLDQRKKVKATGNAPIHNPESVRPPEKMVNSPEIEGNRRLSEPEGDIDVDTINAKVTGLRLKAPPHTAHKHRKPPRKWKDEETQQLLRGVEKHGIGKWKLILDDPAFVFEGRTAVDLKDRYRVCRNTTCKSRDADNLDSQPLRPSSTSTINIASAQKVTPRISIPLPKGSRETPLLMTSKKVPAVADKTVGRRTRRAWTSAEDESLLKGLARYGFQWTAIHDDSELDLSHRKATDLRDRIRYKFPDGYRNAETTPAKPHAAGASQKDHHPSKQAATAVRTGQVGQRKAALVKPRGMMEGTKNADESKSANSAPAESADSSQEQPGMTLPPLTLDDGDWDWGDNTLPPLLDWEEDMGL